MTRYAASTEVTVERSRAEVERILARYGADSFGYFTEPGRSVVQFRYAGWVVRFELPMPDQGDREFQRTPARHQLRSKESAFAAWEQACRQRWRALALAVKAKLEAVECKITSFEEEFLAHLVLPDGRTVGRTAIPQLMHAKETGLLPRTLLGLPAAPEDAIDAEVVE